MSTPLDRRQFVGRALGLGAAGLADLAFLRGLPAVSADEARAAPATVRLAPELEPLVRLIEETPRDKLLEACAEKVREGTGYRQLLGAVFLAGVRGVKPRPVGFQFHAVLVINSAHLAALSSSDKDRWLPLFWALDNFKESQAVNRTKNDGWMLPPVDEAKLPSATEAKKQFTQAMDDWDEEKADAAVAALVRSAGAEELIELFWRYGSRDFRDIGHKAIYVANSWRTLQTIGWRHAEPVMRSLAFALLQHEGDNPARRDADADRPGRDNLKRAAKIRAGWQRGDRWPAAAKALLTALRTGSAGEAADTVVELLNKEVDPASVWDGVFLTAAELLMRQPGVLPVHCVTSANALHYGYQSSSDDETRRLLLLQAASFMAMFRDMLKDRDQPEKLRIDALEKVEVKAEEGPEAVEEIFAAVGREPKDRAAAAGKILSWAARDAGRVEALMTAARRLIFTKGTNAHDYKFSEAALEDYYHATPAWRDRCLAANTFYLRGAGDADNDLIRRAKAALGKA
jgi:hypothetical protein